MYTTKTSLLLVTLIAGVALVQAAGGIKGQRRVEADSQQRQQAIKGPRQQQQYQPLPPPPPPAPIQAPQPQQLQPVRLAPIKGAGQVAPVFNAVRVQPIPPPPPALIEQQPIVQQQQQQVIQQQEQEPEPSQQQQEAEIDPSAAAQDSAPALAAPGSAPAAALAPAGSEEEANPRPEPYAFNYAFDAADSATSGSSQREESQDANGRVTGFYTLRGEDGRDRRVDYVADANGFRATVSTNEMGTAPKDSADVDWQAQSPSDAQLRAADSATQLARQRALANPQPISQQQPIGASSSLSSNQVSKISSPRQNAASSKVQPQQQQQQQLQQSQQQQQIVQLQEPFEQIRQTELNGRARKSRHAPFYLYTV